MVLRRRRAAHGANDREYDWPAKYALRPIFSPFRTAVESNDSPALAAVAALAPTGKVRRRARRAGGPGANKARPLRLTAGYGFGIFKTITWGEANESDG